MLGFAMVERLEGDGGESRKSNARPLYLRIYYESHMTDLVRLFGHAQLPADVAKERLKPLIEKYGEPAMKAAADEIIFVSDTDPPVARLTDEARRLAIQIIGRPPVDTAHNEVAPVALAEPAGKAAVDHEAASKSGSKRRRRKPRTRKSPDSSK